MKAEDKDAAMQMRPATTAEEAAVKPIEEMTDEEKAAAEKKAAEEGEAASK